MKMETATKLVSSNCPTGTWCEL